MIYVISFWDTEQVGQSLDDLHKIAVEEQGTDTPEYSVKTFASEMDYVLRNLPEEFKSYVSMEAWDRGHSSGEVIQIAREMAHDLAEVTHKYRERLVLEWRKNQREQ